LQEIRNSGASGYKYIAVDEDDAANVIYANNTLVHLSAEQIPKGSAVCSFIYLFYIFCKFQLPTLGSNVTAGCMLVIQLVLELSLI